MSLNKKMLKLYAENGFNVLLSGRHGIGKTEIIKEIFSELFEDRWAYFSASTMDAWVDFIGVPKAVTREDNTQVLELIRPARFADDNVEALFFDEYNRSPSKVRNAVMELIQFKSINGRKFKNLKVIWVAINPYSEEGEYDVEKIDPAQMDRFPIKIDMPYKLDKLYFNKKHGNKSKPFVDWWQSLSEDNKYKISPRLLDQSIQIHSIGGDLKHVLPKESNISELIKNISSISLEQEWEDIQNSNKKEKELFFSNLSNLTKFEDFILKDFSNSINFISHDYLINRIEIKDSKWLEIIFKNINKINEEVIKEVESTFNNSFKDVISELLGLTSNNNSLNLKNKNVVITGNFKKLYENYRNDRSGITQLLNSIGANVKNSVSRNTDYVINANNNQSSKTDKAISLGIPIITEEEFHKIYYQA